MQEAVAQMLTKYECKSADDYVHALREILQEIALLGLWRSKFFEKAAFYGGTALRTLYGLDRFSEDLDFSLLEPMADFELKRYSDALEKELVAFGFEVSVEVKNKTAETAVQSAFLKGNTANQLLVIQAGEEIVRQIPPGQIVRIKLEIDTDPPGGSQRRINIFCSQFLSVCAPIPFRICLRGKCMLCFVDVGRTVSRDGIGMIWSGIVRTTRKFIFRIWKNA